MACYFATGCIHDLYGLYLLAFKAIIFTDSLSSLQSISRHTIDHPITLHICVKLQSLITHNYNVIFCWVPSHIGIPGNRRADAAAENTKQLPITHISVPYTDLTSLIYTHINLEWQQEWDSQPNNKLHKIYPKYTVYRLYLHNSVEEIKLCIIA